LCEVAVEGEEDRRSDGAVVRVQWSGEKDCLFSGGIECWHSVCVVVEFRKPWITMKVKQGWSCERMQECGKKSK
jgi:hypothetical protein